MFTIAEINAILAKNPLRRPDKLTKYPIGDIEVQIWTLGAGPMRVVIVVNNPGQLDSVTGIRFIQREEIVYLHPINVIEPDHGDVFCPNVPITSESAEFIMQLAERREN